MPRGSPSLLSRKPSVPLSSTLSLSLHNYDALPIKKSNHNSTNISKLISPKTNLKKKKIRTDSIYKIRALLM